jgi:predicted PurR-regulated permease PerM
MAASPSKGDGLAGGGAGAAIIAAIFVGLLYFGRDVLLPIALAVLLSFVLAPLVRTLQNWWIPLGFSVIAVVLLTFLALFAIGGTIAMEATQLAGDLPRHKSTIDEDQLVSYPQWRRVAHSLAPPRCWRISGERLAPQ